MRGETLCWTCRQAPRGRCAWFARHAPVPGWTAERRDITQQRWDGQGCGTFTTESYRVLACPLYRPDPPRPGRRRRRRAPRRGGGDSAPAGAGGSASAEAGELDDAS